MHKLLAIMCAFVATTSCSSSDNEQSSLKTNELIGAWKIVKTTTASDSNSVIDESPEMGLYVFTDRHFSNMLVMGDEPRKHFSDQRTDEERLTAYDAFIADAGFYEYTDSRITVHNLIAKVPNVMTYELIYEYVIDGNTLRLTFEHGWAPPNGQITYDLIRLE
jgi:hypothetical protein